MAAFQSTQVGRTDLEVGLLVDRWNSLDLKPGTGVEIQPIVFRLPQSGTLPWHLTSEEIASISKAWNNEDNQLALEKLVQFFTNHQE